MLALPAAVAAAGVCTRYGGLAFSAGMGCLVLALLLVVRARSGSTAWTLASESRDPARWRIGLPDGTWRPVSIGPGTRLLGRSVVLRLAVPGPAPRRQVWLTVMDAPPDRLRRLAVLLTAGTPEDRV